MRTSRSNRPESDMALSESPSVLPSPARTPEQAKTLLVVGDDQAVREMVARILARQGYGVLQAQSAAEALHLAGSTRIHLLVTNLSMPEMDGLELARQIRRIHPRTPVLMVSGSLPVLRDGSQDLDRFELLAEPFAFNELLHKVRGLLDATVPLPRPGLRCRD